MRRQKRKTNVEIRRAVSTRISQKMYDELQKMLGSSTLNSMSELIRHILANQKVVHEYYDATLDKVMLELSENRKDIQAIGVNINQVTKRFHNQKWPEAMLVNAREIAGLYQLVDLRMQKLFDFMTEIAQKWLPE